MKVLLGAAKAMGAHRLLDISSAHVDGCLYHGRASLDFARSLGEGGAKVSVPTTLNVGSLDLLHPDLVRLDEDERAASRSLMETYVALGCRATWTCAPYQLVERPNVGEQIAWAESNAIVFANSVLGARTERYGDFMDICAAVTGRAPATGLHLDEGRLATLVVSVDSVADHLDHESMYPLIGFLLGRLAGTEVAALTGLPSSTTEDQLKALGAAAASSGAVAMFHAVGLTPEAPDLATATGGKSVRMLEIDADMVWRARQTLSTTSGGRVDAVSLGTPHYSHAEIQEVCRLLDGRTCSVPLYVSTGRDVLEQLDDAHRRALEISGVTMVIDTCTYITPILAGGVGVVMTDSAKWAYYAPSNLGVDVIFGSVAACVESAVAGHWVDPS